MIAGDHTQGHLFVTGEAVNVAKRLEEAAATNEILIGEPTHRLVRDAVVVEPSGAAHVKHGETIHGLASVDVFAHAPGHAAASTRRSSGASASVLRSRASFGNAVRDRACHLLTVLGGAGIGKSRLVREFVGALAGDVTVLRGRCLPYGEGITYWPLAEVVRESRARRAWIRASSPRRSPRGSRARKRPS